MREFTEPKKVIAHRGEHTRAKKNNRAYDAYKTYEILDPNLAGIAKCPLSSCKNRDHANRFSLIDHLLQKHKVDELKSVNIVKSYLQITRDRGSIEQKQKHA